jgi:hypothetical protein
MSRCVDCGLWLDASCFFRDSSRSSGLANKCKACELKRKRDRYAKNPGPQLERRGSYVRENRNELAWRRARSVEQLSDSYIKKRLLDGTTLKAANLSSELIQLKREEMSLRRLGKRMEQASQQELSDEPV